MKKQILLTMAGALLAVHGAVATPPSPHQSLAEPMALKPVFGTRHIPSSRVKIPMKAPAVTPEEYIGRKFGGALIYTDSWPDMWITDVPYGLYDFTIGKSGITREVRFQEMSNNWMSGAPRNNRFYGIRNINMMGALTGVAVAEIDMTTWKSVREVFAENPTFGLLPSTMTYDMTSGEIYGIFYNDDLSGLNWSRYDTKNLEQDIICRFGGKFNVVALASAPDGVMYAVSADGDLYTVNKDNARVSLVGYTGVNVAAYSQSMTWDAGTNTFLWAAVTPTGSALYSLDPEGPESTLIKKFNEGEQFASVYLPEQSVMAGAPAAPKELKWNFSSPGAFDGTVSVISPDAGEITVYLDGERIKDGEKVSAGARLDIPFSGLTNKTHHVSAVVKNDKGWSPMVEKFQYAGYDVPRPVTDVRFEEKDGVATVTWSAPEGGEEDGYIDPDKLSYRIYRLPDEVLVAENHRSTTFTETLPTGVKRYAYRVVPFNGDEKQGAPVISNALVYGKAYELPYVDNFDMDGCLDVYTIIDGDGDNQTWNINPYGDVPLLACSVTFGDADVTDDWILSPNISLEKGNLYRVTINMRNTWPGEADLLSVGFCDSGNSAKEGVTVVETLSVNTPSMTRLDHCVDFKVDNDGDYKVALGLVSPKGTGGGVFISRLGVEKVGSLQAPAAVSDLTLVPDATGAPEALLSFTAPSKTIAGEVLSGPMTAVIYRDGAKVGEVDNISPGESASWTDKTGVAPGKHTYTVRMSNSFGEGQDASASDFVGVYRPPFFDPLDTREAIGYYTYKTVGFEDSELNSGMHYPTWGDPSLEVDHNNQSDENHEMYVVFPLIAFDDESVYKVSYDIKTMKYGEGFEMEMTYGDSVEPSDQTGRGFDIPAPEGWDFETQENLLVLTEGGRKYLSFHITAPTQGYLYLNLRNIRVEYEGSALAPDVVTDLVATSDLTSKLTLKAPAVDYAGRPLRELEKVEIYRNGSVLPVHTFEKPAPGESLEWVDENALLGTNSYFIVSSNSHGRGNAVTVKSFIGYDEPVAPENIAIVPNQGNQTATVSWQVPRRGVNGGVLNEDEMSFTLVRYYPGSNGTEGEVKVMKTGIKGTSVVPDREATDDQEMVYYGVATVTPQGVSEPAVYFTILGKPYSLPFKESFTDGEASTGLWLNAGNTNYGLQAMPTSGDLLEYNGFPNTSQDDDNGVFLFLNGALSENPVPFAVLSPKIDLGGETSPRVSFWLYKGNQSGSCQTVPSLDVYASVSEADFQLLGRAEWTENTPAWVEYSYSLDRFAGEPGALIFQFVATSGMFTDIILMDNFRVDGPSAIDTIGTDCDDISVFGINGGIVTRGAAGLDVRVYAAGGMLVDSYMSDDDFHAIAPGFYVVGIGNRAFKVVVR